MTPEEIEEMKKLEMEAAHGPWCKDYCYTAIRHVEKNCDLDCYTHPYVPGESTGCLSFGRYDGPFIAAARSFIPKAIEKMEKDRVEIERLKLQFEAHNKHIGEFLSQLYGIMVDPLSEEIIEVKEVRAALIIAATDQRDEIERLKSKQSDLTELRAAWLSYKHAQDWITKILAAVKNLAQQQGWDKEE